MAIKAFTTQPNCIACFLKYGSIAGPPELQDAVSGLVNNWFSPSVPIEPGQILVTNGVSSLLDVVAFNIAEAGDGILIPVPMYSMFEQDVCARAGLTILPVQMAQAEDQFDSSHRDIFIAKMEKFFQSARKKKIRVKAVVISNPCNPFGRFYSRDTLIGIAQFCGRHELHFVADEIYALSGFESQQGLPGFTSVLSLPHDPKRGLYHQNIHSLYGASKDWAMGGLRLGFLITRNPEIWNTCRRLALFTWVSPFSTSFFTKFIGDKENVAKYISLNRSRLRGKYEATTTLLQQHGIPFHAGNGGLFIWIDLSGWLFYFPGTDDPTKPEATRETRLCKYLIQKGVYMSMGELSFSPDPGHFRFVYTSPGDEALVAVRRIGEACSELSKGGKVTPGTCDVEISTLTSVEWGKVEAQEKCLDGTRQMWKRFLCM